MKNKIGSLVVLAIGVGLAYWFIQRLDLKVVGGHLGAMRVWPVIAAAMLINLTLLVRSLRWRTFLSPIAQVSLGGLFAATTIGFGSVFIFGRAGEIVRPMVLSLRERVHPGATIATIFVERVFDMSAVALLFAVNLLFFRLPAGRESEAGSLVALNRLGLALTAGIIGGIAALILFRLKTDSIISFIKRTTTRVPQRLMRPILAFIDHLSTGLSVLLNTRELLVALFHTALVWSLVTAATWLVVLAFNLEMPLSSVIFLLGFGLVGSLVPTPGGSAGAFHAAAATGLIFLGIEQNLAGSVAIVFHFVAFGPPFILGLFYLVRDGIGLGSLREMMAAGKNSDAKTSSPTSATE